MPEYLAPGVFIEETSFRAKSIEGVSTTTTGFVGPTRYGPLRFEPDVLTSLVEFERTYGDGQKLDFGVDGILDNFVWHAARAFFEEGGKRLYVKRVYNGDDVAGCASANFPTRVATPSSPPSSPPVSPPSPPTPASPPTPPPEGQLHVRARYPGLAGALRVRFTVEVGQNVLIGVADPLDEHAPLIPRVNGLGDGDLVLITDAVEPAGTATPTRHGDGLFQAERFFDEATSTRTWRFIPQDGTGTVLLADLTPAASSGGTRQRVQPLTMAVAVTANEPGAAPEVWAGLPFDPEHERAGSPDSVFAHFGDDREARDKPILIELGEDETGDPLTGLGVLALLFWEGQDATGWKLEHSILDPDSGPDQLSVEFLLHGGDDGTRPLPKFYEGSEDPADNHKTGLVAFEDIDDISIIAAPGSTFGYDNGWRDKAQATVLALIAHATKMKYRIAVVDSGNDQAITDVRSMRAKFDSKYAAFYYPWVRVLDPITGLSNVLPPSGFVAGIYARNDIERAVYKAPANEVVNLAIGFEKLLNKSQQEVLNPEGINCFRFFEGRGYRLWGARTMSSDPEWKYVNLRRYFAFLEHSIDRGTQWAVFEPNGEQLWANVRRTIEDFLFDQWQNNALLGDKPEKAYFVRCDRSTMTQNDLDNGRLVCLIGVAPLRPAEFVIFRIGQWTGDRKG